MTGMIERFGAQGIASWNVTSPVIVLSAGYIEVHSMSIKYLCFPRIYGNTSMFFLNLNQPKRIGKSREWIT